MHRQRRRAGTSKAVTDICHTFSVSLASSGQGWSRKSLAAAKALGGIRLARAAPRSRGRRASSIARVVRAYYLG